MLSKRMVSLISKILFNLDVLLGGLGWGFLGFFWEGVVVKLDQKFLEKF